METTREIVVRFSFSRRQALLAIVAFFIAWHPGFIGSETLTLTTYYPAPYGGYVNLLTTGQTLLARNAGNLGVGLFPIASPAPQSKVDIRVPSVAGVSDGVQIADDAANPDTRTYATFGITRSAAAANQSYIGLTRAGQFPWGMGMSNTNSFIMGQALGRNIPTPTFTLTQPDVNGESSLFLGNDGLNPTNRMLYVEKDIRIGTAGSGASGGLYGLCSTTLFGNGVSSCGPNEVVTAIYGQECDTGGMLYRQGGGDVHVATNWTPHRAQNCSGTMLCCRIFANTN